MRKTAFVEETEYIMHTNWPSLQGEVKTIVEVELQENSDYSAAEMAAEQEYIKNTRNPRRKITWGRNETSFKTEEPDGQVRYFSYREI